MLRITQGYSQIGIQTTNTRMEIQQPKAEQQIKQTPPKLMVKTEPAQVIIDQSQCFAEAGLKGPMELSRENSSLAHSAALQGIARRASEGDMMAAIEQGGDAIAEMAFNIGLEERVFDIATIPKSRPIIDFKGGVQIDWQLGGTDITSRPNKPIVNVTPGRVDINLIKRAFINIEYVGKNIDVSK